MTQKGCNRVKRLFLGMLASSTLLLAACGGGGSTVTPSNPAAQPVAPTSSGVDADDFARNVALGYFRPSCSTDTMPDQARCFAYVLTPAGRAAALAREAQTGVRTISATTPGGYGPPQLQSAYKLSSAIGGGAGRTVAIVDSNDDPNAESDLAVYRAQFGLPACTTANGCFKKVGQTGTSSLPAPDAGWAEEISLDVDMVSANCPNCHILLVEVNSASFANLAAGVNTAASLGAFAISNSYGGAESSSETTYAPSYNHAGIAITASNGDSGYGSAAPAAYNTLTAVGGTNLKTASNSRGWTETVWTGTGSGCSRYISKPSWQHDTGCTRRMIGDVAYVADPNTGVAVYDSYGGDTGWEIFGGTSAGSPAIAAIYALSGIVVSNASYGYSHTSSLFDVTTGSNGSCSPAYFCHGEVGYDGPTGNGTPNGIGAF
jgi:subtilase family serine protease